MINRKYGGMMREEKTNPPVLDRYISNVNGYPRLKSERRNEINQDQMRNEAVPLFP